MNKEKELKAIMRDVECTREEAEEIFKLEQKAKENKSAKIYAQSEKPKTRTKRKTAENPTKADLISRIYQALDGYPQDIKIKNPTREIIFTLADNEYSIILIKHKKKE